ncbi:MAG TPA: TIGR01620 family protein [Methylovirgula sp.]
MPKRPSPVPARPRPQAFRVHTEELETPDSFSIETLPDFLEAEAAAQESATEVAVEVAQSRGILARRLISWGGLFFSAASGFVLLALSNWVFGLVVDLFSRSRTLGLIAIGFGAVAGIALLVLILREVFGIVRQGHIAHLHIAFAGARAKDDREAARREVGQLVALYASRPELARVRTQLTDLTKEIIDGRDLIDIAERDLVAPLDDNVRREIAQAAKRVSLVTAIAPRAMIDVLFVGGQALYLVRRIAEIYGGRPGFFGFLKLMRSVGAHLAITGGVAVGDSLLQQLLGHGIAAKLSARLGEGVLNGLLTTRVGLSAMAVCRPMPFEIERPPRVADVAPFLFSNDKTA